MLLRLVLSLIFVFDTTFAFATTKHVASRAPAQLDTPQARLELLERMPSWEFFADNLLAGSYSSEDVAFFKQALHKAGISPSERISIRSENGIVTITIGKTRLKLEVSADGKRVKFDGYVLSLNSSETLEQNYHRFEKILSAKQASRLLLPSAEASVAKGIVLIVAGVAVGVLALVGAPAWLTAVAAALVWTLILTGGDSASKPPLRDYKCHEDGNGVDVQTTDGGKIVFDKLSSGAPEIHRFGSDGVEFKLADAKVNDVKSQLSSFGNLCPDDPARHEQIRGYLAQVQGKLPPKSNGIYQQRK